MQPIKNTEKVWSNSFSEIQEVAKVFEHEAKQILAQSLENGVQFGDLINQLHAERQRTPEEEVAERLKMLSVELLESLSHVVEKIEEFSYLMGGRNPK